MKDKILEKKEFQKKQDEALEVLADFLDRFSQRFLSIVSFLFVLW